MQGKKMVEFASKLWALRQGVEANLTEIAGYIYPDKAGFDRRLDPSDENRQNIFDGTPEEAASMLSAALGSLLTNPATSWFTLDLAGDVEAERGEAEWLSQVARTMLDVFADPATGFQTEVNCLYDDLAAFGWGVFFTEERDGAGVRSSAIATATCAIAEDMDGRVDTVVRKYTRTASQIAEEFGKENLPDLIKNSLASNAQKEFELWHVVMPRAKLPADIEVDSAKNGEKNGDKKPTLHPIVSMVLEANSQAILHQGGFFEFPYQVPRWKKRAGEVYGRGCGHAALPDIRVLNTVSEAQLLAAEKMSDPPLLVPDDSAVGRINTHAGGVTYYTMGRGDIRPLPVASNLDVMQIVRTEKQDAIRKAFLNDRIQLVGGPQMTATEFVGRERKQMLILGPVLGRLQTEFLGPLVERYFGILMRRQALPPPPEELAGQTIRVRYVSPIARAQKQGEAEAFTQCFAYLAPLLQTNPSLLEHFDGDAIVRDSQDIYGYPLKYLRPLEELQKMREAKQIEIQKMQEMEQMMALANATGASNG